MLGLAVGIDYALFILARHRQNIGDGLEPREAAAQATGTAGSAVVFAGATVVIALVGLTVVNIPFLTVMGLAAAGAVIDRGPDRDDAAAGAARLRRPPGATRQPRAGLASARRREPGRETASVRYARFVTRRPLPVLVAGLVLLGVVAAAGART